ISIMAGKMHDDASSCLKWHTVRLCEEGFVNQLVRFPGLSVKDQLLDLGQCRPSFFIVVTVRPTSPDRLLIKLQLFTLRYSVYHRSQVSIAYGSCLFPDFRVGRFVLPLFLTRMLLCENRHSDIYCIAK